MLRLLYCLLAGLLIANPGAAQVLNIEDERLSGIQTVPLDEIARDGRWAEYVPIARQRLNELLTLHAKAKGQPENSIHKIEFFSSLEGTSLANGTVVIELEAATSGQLSQQLPSLGKTNLRDLKVSSAGRPIPLASKPDGSLVALAAPESTILTGTWSALGSQPGRSVVFELQLPNAQVSVFTITTDKATQITSPNALVCSEVNSQGTTDWKLYPNNRTTLTITCSGNIAKQNQEVAFVDQSTDIRIGPEKALASWVLSVPQQLNGCKIDFIFSQQVTVNSVGLSDGSNVKWEVSSGPKHTVLAIYVPQISAERRITVDARLEQFTRDDLQLPFLSPVSFFNQNEDFIGTLQLHANSIRMTVSPLVVLKDLSLNGVHERSVSYPSDGSHVIEMIQHSAEPSIAVSLSESQAILADAVVVKVSAADSEIEAIAFVNVTAKTGTAGTVRWTIPAAWRVTEVRELNTDNQPLLFNVTSDNNTARQTELEATLRTPLLPGASQSFSVRMQSIEGSLASQKEPAGLYTSDYIRRHDYLVTTSGVANPFSDDWNTSTLTGENLCRELPWLPLDIFAATVAYERRQLSSEATNPSTDEEVFATVDYNINEAGKTVLETARIRMRSRSDIPARIPILVTSGIDLRISEELNTQPIPALVRVNSSEGIDEWILELPPESQSTRELDFVLNGRRDFVDGMPAMVIAFDGIRRNGGTIQPPDPGLGIQLMMQSGESDTPLNQALQYPTTDFTLTIKRTQVEVSQQVVSGREFVIIRPEGSGYAAESLCRFLVQSTADRNKLALKTGESDTKVFINGRPVYPEVKGKYLQIPLPQNDRLASVDVYVKSSTKERLVDGINSPVAIFPEADSSQITTFLLSELSIQLSPALEDSEPLPRRPGMDVAELMLNRLDASSHFELKSILQEFRSQWILASANSTNTVVLGTTASQEPVALSLINRRRSLMAMSLWAATCLVSLLLTNAVRLRTCGIALLLVTGLQLILPDSTLTMTHGITLGVLFFALYRGGLLVTQRTRQHQGPTRKTIARTLGILLTVYWLPTHAIQAQDKTPRPQIIAPNMGDEAFPLLYIDQSFLAELNEVTSIDESAAAVVESQVDITFESPGAAYANVKLTVATHELADQSLPIPLDGVTLVECSVDGDSVFPTRNQEGQTSIAIPMASLLPNRRLSTQDNLQAADGPRQYGDWHLRTVAYTVRIATRAVGQEYRLTLPYPPSPKAVMTLLNPSQTIVSARIGTEVMSFETSDQVRRFRATSIYNENEVEVAVRLEAISNEPNRNNRKSRLLCSVDLAPGNIRTTSTYRVVPFDSQSTEVTIATASQYRTTSVESLTGTPLPLIAGDHTISVNVPVDSSNEQVCVVHQTIDTPVSLSRSIVFHDFARINGQLPDEAILRVRTAEQFIVKSILGDGKPLQQLATPGGDRDTETNRSTERTVAVPPTLEVIEVELVERTATRVARVTQNAVVKDEVIDWNCQAEIEISGKPAFRQVLNISESVRISEILVTNGGTNRLQSWTRSGNSVVVSLREATRGILLIELRGTIRRNKEIDTSLPVIAFPEDVEVLESSLELSANARTQTLISSLAGARPNTPVDASLPLNKVPVSLTITDDARPVIIQVAPERKLKTEITSVLYEVSGQIRVALAIAIESSDNSSAIRFRKKGSDVTSPQPVARRNNERINLTNSGEVYVIPPPEGPAGRAKTVVVLSDLIPAIRGGSLTVPVPEFDAETEVMSCLAFDTRDPRLPVNVADSTFPEFAADAFTDMNFGSTLPSSSPQPAEFDATNRRVIIRPASQTQSVAKTSTRREAVHIECEHFLRSEPDCYSGKSGFMVFSSQPDSTVKFVVPEKTSLTRVAVNGTDVSFVISRGVCSLSMPSRICHVVVDWQASSRTQTGTFRATVPLISVASKLAQCRISVSPPTSRQAWWSVEGTPESDDTYNTARATSIMTGLRMIEEIDPLKFDAATENLPSEVPPAMPEQAWIQLCHRAPNAAQSLETFLKQQSIAPKDQSQRRSLSEPSIIIEAPHLPPMLPLATVSIAVLLLAGSGLLAKRKVNATYDGESVSSTQPDEPERHPTTVGNTDSRQDEVRTEISGSEPG